MNEKERVEAVSNWYLDEQLGIDKKLIEFRYRTWIPFMKGRFALELGPAEGQMTQFLVNHFESLTVVEGASQLLNLIPDYHNLIKVNSLFEEYDPKKRFDTIFLEHILEHVDQPVALLKMVRKWLAPEGRLLLGVPNGNSLHRLVAVKMGILKNSCELNERDISQGHRRVYTQDTLSKDIEASGLHIDESGGVFLKPVSNGQIQDGWNEEMIQGFYELGKDFPEYTADIYAVCSA